MAGKIHGGQQPVTGASIDLYAAGTAGYGSTGTHLATTTSDSYGTFGFTQDANYTGALSATYACPSSGSQLYIVASGGNPLGSGNGSNSALVMAVAIGQCGAVSALSVNVDEVTSTATMAALQQYFNPVTQSFGYPSTTQGILGFANNVSLISNLVDYPTGTAHTSVTQSAVPLGHGTLTGTSVSVTVTPEYNKINLIANILAACVNTTSSATNVSSACSTLFTNAKPPTAAFTSQPTLSYSGITATNETTLQALYFMLTNPTSGGASGTNANASGTPISNLYALASTVAPFQPYYVTAPTDWTVGVTYQSTSTCVTQVGSAYPSGTQTTTDTAAFLGGLDGISIDAKGNLWGVTYNPENLFELSPTGVPLTCGLGSGFYKSSTTAIDPAGYIWTTTIKAVNGSQYLYKWNPTTGTLDSSWSVGANPATALAIDGSGNVFYTTTYTSGTPAVTYSEVNEFPLAGVAGASPTTISSQTVVSGLTGVSLTELAVDSAGNLFDSNSATPQEIDYIYPSGGTYASRNIADTNTLTPHGIAIGQDTSAAETVNVAGGSWESFYLPATVGGAPTSNFETSTGTYVAGLVQTGSPHGLAVDGGSNVWATCQTETGNYVTLATSTTYSLCEISRTGINLSATYVTAGKSYGGFQKPTTFITNSPVSIGVDPSGNVWAGNNTTTGAILELVGAAVPVVTPISVAVGNGTLGTKP